MDKVEELLTRGVANVIPGKEELKKVLENDKKLNVYIGIDPTATKIHLGHAVPLRKLQALAELGHNVTFLIGDFTALIGDTSDKNTERPVLTNEQIEANFQTYKSQAEKILDFSKVKVRHNSEWLKPLSFEEIVRLCQHFSVGDFVGRELIRRRLQDNKRVALHEVLYPVMQGYDSYFMDTDIQIGGTDQTFNMQAGRTLQKDLRNKESFVLATEFLIGTDGQKMSKSLGNAIWLDEEPHEMYAEVMAIKDDLVLQYFTLATNKSLEEIKSIEEHMKSGSPLDIKHELAMTIVTELHRREKAEEAKAQFGKAPVTVSTLEIPVEDKVKTWEEILVEHNVLTSKSEVKRLSEQGGLRKNGEAITNSSSENNLDTGDKVELGKRRLLEIKVVN